MVLFNEKKACCGCAACMNICPTGAISMKADEEGFWYPSINSEQCTSCGLCKARCAFQNESFLTMQTPSVFAMKHVDDTVRMNSTSGGAFTAFSDVVLRDEGAVYGAAFDDNFDVIHIRTDSQGERNRCRGSKYVQSDMQKIYPAIKKDLNAGKKVLFSGTPCQGAGLKAYLGREYPLLYILDLVCHGVSSPKLWREHILSLENEYGPISEYCCRSKINGWSYTETCKFINGKALVSNKSALCRKQMVLFYSNTILRPSCFVCPYASLKRASDLTLSDFWGIERCHPLFRDEKGVSMLLVNTEKGRELLMRAADSVILLESTCEAALFQRNLREPTSEPNTRTAFWDDYKIKGYNYIIRKYAGYSFFGIIKYFIKMHMRPLAVALQKAKNLLTRNA